MCWQICQDEFQNNWISVPTQATDEELTHDILTPRFVIKQKNKNRIIDNLRSSGLNSTMETSETAIPETVDRVAGVVKIVNSFAEKSVNV